VGHCFRPEYGRLAEVVSGDLMSVLLGLGHPSPKVIAHALSAGF
jgi:hypothetical protein